MNILEITNLSVEYYRNHRVIPAVRNVSLSVEQGETLAVVGESGCGKSSLALAVMRLIFPEEGKITSGSVVYNGRNILEMGNDELRGLRGKDISVVFQDPASSLNPVLSVREQLIETVEAHAPGRSREEKEQLLKDALAEVLLSDHSRMLNSYPHQLSGGQKQRIAIAAAIINRPGLLIADEPTTALDVTIQKEILDLLDKLKNELSLTVILITHNIPLAYERCRNIAVMYAGEIVEYGGRDDVFKNPRHPYTAALIKSVPRLERFTGKHFLLPGQPPDPSSLPKGCKFHPRCEKAMDICRTSEPGECTVNNTKVKCFLYK
ncbi:MAG: ABC transporter ATP-binding protein [Elusimicrobiota bacterium]